MLRGQQGGGVPQGKLVVGVRVAMVVVLFLLRLLLLLLLLRVLVMIGSLVVGGVDGADVGAAAATATVAAVVLVSINRRRCSHDCLLACVRENHIVRSSYLGQPTRHYGFVFFLSTVPVKQSKCSPQHSPSFFLFLPDFPNLSYDNRLCCPRGSSCRRRTSFSPCRSLCSTTWCTSRTT